jgi:hypothetical protein
MMLVRDLGRILIPAGCGAGLVALTLAIGCQAPGPAIPTGRELRDDIVAIQQFPPTNPWVRDEAGRVVGLLTRVYFLPSAGQKETPKGVFVPGVIKAALYAMVPREHGGLARVPVTEWSFDRREAEGLRINHPSVMGESYGLVLRWPASADVAGREIQLVLSYERMDGERVVRRGTRFRVPLPLGVSSSHPEARAPARDPAQPQVEPRRTPPPRRPGLS